MKIRSKSLIGTYKRNGNIVKDYHIITSQSKEYKMRETFINGKKTVQYLDIHFISNAGRMNYI
jgi:hypothetical protein